MKTLIKSVINNLDQNNIENPQFRWWYLKFEIWKFSTNFSKDIMWNMKTERTHSENELKTYKPTTNFAGNPEYIETNEKI